MSDGIEYKKVGELAPPMRLMMTPGPSSIDPRVYRALAAPIVGHIDPWFKTCMDETQILMRQVFQTENRVTMPLSHGETSSGVVTQLDPFRKVADELGALLIVDTVASLAAEPLDVDKQRLDIVFSGSQKALSAPPGMSPITVSPRAEEVLRNRKKKVQSWYFDLTTAMNYWGKDRLYHHTPPISLIYALREAMRLTMEEGLANRWERHRMNQQALIAGVEAMGLDLLVENPKDRLVTVTPVMVPAGVDDVKFRNQLLDEFNIEIAGGIGPLKGKIWRLGLMGYCAQKANVLLLLAAMEKVMVDQGGAELLGRRSGGCCEQSLIAK